MEIWIAFDVLKIEVFDSTFNVFLHLLNTTKCSDLNVKLF
jgi:hypothetical protein